MIKTSILLMLCFSLSFSQFLYLEEDVSLTTKPNCKDLYYVWYNETNSRTYSKNEENYRYYECKKSWDGKYDVYKWSCTYGCYNVIDGNNDRCNTPCFS